MKQQLVIQGVATGSSTKVTLKPKPVQQKPKYQAPPPKQSIKKQTKVNVPQQQQQKQQQQQQKPPETKVVQLTESILSDKSEPDQQQFKLQQEPIKQNEFAQIHVPVYGEVTVKYSHYNEKFPIKDGQLLAKAIDEKYCLSFVFQGQYKLILKSEDKKKIFEFSRGGWDGCENGKTYYVEVEEDPIQEEWDRKNSKPYQAPKEDTCPLKNKKLELITSELKAMSIDEIKDKGSKFKELIEARDLEDILFK
ncbi:unnamed protein product [Paramecium pentaurelia]|uniref:Uncharacterized protein n=1 Tax=Paramecium pentaurelia TaxID=43138 RepID=A0A8S1RTY8_9CILI|nr:unnamed protein product [Paramecium pentaurelia]